MLYIFEAVEVDGEERRRMKHELHAFALHSLVLHELGAGISVSIDLLLGPVNYY